MSPTPDPIPQLLRRRKTATLLDCSVDRIRRLEKAGRLPVIRISTRVYHRAADVARLIAECEEAGQ